MTKFKIEIFRFQKFQPLIVAGIIFLMIPFTDWCINRTNIPENILLVFNQKIIIEEKALTVFVETISTNIDPNTLSNATGDSIYKLINHEKPKISLFIFRNDSLIFWNSNREIFPTDLVKSSETGFQILHLQNGWYSVYTKTIVSCKFIAFALIKNEYPITNSYLKNCFSEQFSLPENVSLSVKTTAYPVFSANNKYLVSLVLPPQLFYKLRIPESFQLSNNFSIVWYFVLFLLGTCFLLLFIYRIFLSLNYFKIRKIQFLLSISSIVLVLRIIQFYLQFPEHLYQTEIFSPALYSSSFILPSLGDFFFNSLLIFYITWIIGKVNSVNQSKTFDTKVMFIEYQVLLVVLFSLFAILEFLITDLIINSSFSLNFQNISDLTPISIFGLLILALLSGAFLIISNQLLDKIFSISSKIEWLIFGLIVSSILYGITCKATSIKINYAIILFFFVNAVFYWYLKSMQIPKYSIQHILFLLLFYSILATFLLNRANTLKENNKVNLLALNLISKQNPVTEDRYYQIAGKLRSDSILKRMLLSENSHEYYSDSLDIYLKTRYFKDYWRMYNIQITLCKPRQELRVEPKQYLIDCNLFFQNLIINYGETTSTPGLYYLDNGYGKEYYLAFLNFLESNAITKNQAQLYIEFTITGTIPDPGYPGLLLDKGRKDPTLRSNYTYAFYQQGRLVHVVGNANYLFELATYPHYSSVSPYFYDNDLKHFHFKINEDCDLLISKTRNGFFSEITPFSYLFFLYSFMALIITGFNMVQKGIYSKPVDLRTKLQISLTSLLILTMVIIGIVQIIYIININEKKNIDFLREKAFSVLTEFQHKFGGAGVASDVINRKNENFLIKLSNIFFCDINFYNVRGFLISSSRHEIFHAGLISERINPFAYQKMIIEHNSILIQEEVIGNMKFGSVYLPMHNDQGNLLGYINLPYFSRLDDLKKEISSFLVTFVNIYILIILSGALISFLLANYITSPLALLSTKMSLLRLGKPNEKILWKNNDEIGRLVADYNRMVDALDNSANQLALKERESAWREMARQVAHEIKNPLTPMKLSAQYLQKSWIEHAPDMGQRIARFTKTLVEQIDTLSTIASDFSGFAKMTPPIFERFDIVEVINTVLALYPESTNIRYVFESENNASEILSDRFQFIRVLTNLINNAVQAIGSRKDGLIRIILHETSYHLIIKVSDNGIGIPADRASNIFQPDFTTKTGGMGLGLAIVKGIILDLRGEISFTSIENTGTNFTISLPKNIKNNDGKSIQN